MLHCSIFTSWMCLVVEISVALFSSWLALGRMVYLVSEDAIQSQHFCFPLSVGQYQMLFFRNEWIEHPFDFLFIQRPLFSGQFFFYHFVSGAWGLDSGPHACLNTCSNHWAAPRPFGPVERSLLLRPVSALLSGPALYFHDPSGPQGLLIDSWTPNRNFWGAV